MTEFLLAGKGLPSAEMAGAVEDENSWMLDATFVRVGQPRPLISPSPPPDRSHLSPPSLSISPSSPRRIDQDNNWMLEATLVCVERPESLITPPCSQQFKSPRIEQASRLSSLSPFSPSSFELSPAPFPTPVGSAAKDVNVSHVHHLYVEGTMWDDWSELDKELQEHGGASAGAFAHQIGPAGDDVVAEGSAAAAQAVKVPVVLNVSASERAGGRKQCADQIGRRP